MDNYFASLNYASDLNYNWHRRYVDRSFETTPIWLQWQTFDVSNFDSSSSLSLYVRRERVRVQLNDRKKKKTEKEETEKLIHFIWFMDISIKYWYQINTLLPHMDRNSLMMTNKQIVIFLFFHKIYLWMRSKPKHTVDRFLIDTRSLFV